VVTAQQADTLGEHGVTDIDGLVNTSVDDLVEFLDVSLDEAENILSAARSVIEIRDRSLQPVEEGSEEALSVVEDEGIALSPEAEEEASHEPVEDQTASGYDEAVERGIPYSAEEKIRAEYSADPVALTEADPMSVDELVLQEAGHDLRPDVITPAADSISPAAAVLAAELEEEDASEESHARMAEPASTETETSSALESSSDEQAATNESVKDEKQ
jgi:hypothetical protein